jgi:hypothetical protein
MHPAGAEAQPIFAAQSARLNGLRKKADFLAEYAKSRPQGLKAALIVLILCPG